MNVKYYYQTIYYFYRDLYVEIVELQQQVFIDFELKDSESKQLFNELYAARKQVYNRMKELETAIIES